MDAIEAKEFQDCASMESGLQREQRTGWRVILCSG